MKSWFEAKDKIATNLSECQIFDCEEAGPKLCLRSTNPQALKMKLKIGYGRCRPNIYASIEQRMRVEEPEGSPTPKGIFHQCMGY